MHKPPDCLKLSTFQGTYEESATVPSFLRRTAAYMTYHKLTEPATQLAALYSCFPMGTASALWFEKAVSTMTNFADFRAQFVERFHLEIADRTKYLGKLETFHQRSGDSVISYYSGLTEMYDNLAQLDMIFHPDQVKMKFIAGLRPDLRAVVLTQESIYPLSQQTALTIAMNHERNLPRVARPIPTLNALGVDDEGDADGPPCGYCKQTGHVFDDCPRVLAKNAAGTWIDHN